MTRAKIVGNKRLIGVICNYCALLMSLLLLYHVIRVYPSMSDYKELRSALYGGMVGICMSFGGDNILSRFLGSVLVALIALCLSFAFDLIIVWAVFFTASYICIGSMPNKGRGQWKWLWLVYCPSRVVVSFVTALIGKDVLLHNLGDGVMIYAEAVTEVTLYTYLVIGIIIVMDIIVFKYAHYQGLISKNTERKF